jgi:DNA polymerase-3 subunit beta
MEIVAAKKDLLRLLELCQGVADRKSTMPALANVLFSASAAGLSISATDLYLAVNGTTRCDIVRPGSVAVPAHETLERIKAMPDGPVQISANESAKTEFRAVGYPRRYTLHGIPGNEFPPLPQPSASSAELELPAASLARLIGRTRFSISTDDTRANVNSALFEARTSSGGRLVRMVSTDGHRLTKAEELDVSNGSDLTMLIPLKAIAELARLAEQAMAAGPNTPVRITYGGNAHASPAFFQVGDTQLGVKLVDAVFPPYQQVIPAAPPRRVVAPRKQLAESLRAVSLATNDRSAAVKLTLTPGLLRITCESPESGNALDEVPVEYDGANLVIGFNARYFLDVLGALDDESVALLLGGELDPATIRLASPTTSDVVAVIMPMRI